jgi:hypothetical protein
MLTHPYFNALCTTKKGQFLTGGVFLCLSNLLRSAPSMGLPLPNTNATVQFCAYVLSFLRVQLFVVVINCGDAKCVVDVADVILIANVGHQS